MKKRFFTFVTLGLFQMASAFAPNFDARPERNIVLGLDKTAYVDESPLRFPCTRVAGVISCGQIQFEDRTCENSLFFDRIANKMEISCMVRLQKIVLAQVDTRDYVNGTRKERYGFYPLRLSPNVSLKTTFNGQLFLSLK